MFNVRWFKAMAILLACCFAFSGVASSATTKHINLEKQNTISLIGGVDSMSVNPLILAIQKSDQDTLFFVIDSPGGSVDDGLRLIDVMKSSGKKFICIAASAASMAFSILQQCDTRYVLESSIIMQHIGSYGLEGPENKNKSYALFVDKEFRRLNELDSKRMGLSQDEFYKKIQNDWWMFGDEAVKFNAADGVVSASCSKDMAYGTNTETYQFMFVSIIIVRSDCPLVPNSLSVSFSVKEGASMEQAEQEVKSLGFDSKKGRWTWADIANPKKKEAPIFGK